MQPEHVFLMFFIPWYLYLVVIGLRSEPGGWWRFVSVPVLTWILAFVMPFIALGPACLAFAESLKKQIKELSSAA